MCGSKATERAKISNEVFKIDISRYCAKVIIIKCVRACMGLCEIFFKCRIVLTDMTSVKVAIVLI